MAGCLLMIAVTIETSPTRLYAHLTADTYSSDLVLRLMLRGYRRQRTRYSHYWAVPMGDVEQLAQDLTAFGYAVVVQGEAA